MVEFTEEALRIMRRALRGGVVEFRTDQHAVEGYEAGPIPAAPDPALARRQRHPDAGGHWTLE